MKATTSAPERAQRVGKLTLEGEVSTGFLVAKCDCGYPCVLVPEGHWGSVMGCAACHAAAAKRAEEEAAYEAKQAQAQEREQRWVQRQRLLNLSPHYDELARHERKLFQKLATFPSFTVAQVAKLIGTASTEEAWAALLPLLEANLLVERRGPFGELRPYRAERAYAAECDPASTFACRGVALRQMREVETVAAARAAAKREAPQVPADAQRATCRDLALETLRDFIAARCEVAPAATESDLLLRSKFVAWAEENRQPMLEPVEFTEALASLGFTTPEGAKRRAGLRLLLLRELASATAQ